MKLSGKQQLINTLRAEADELRAWMSEHSTPSTPIAEFDRVANRYAILCTRIYIIEKQW